MSLLNKPISNIESFFEMGGEENLVTGGYFHRVFYNLV